MWSGGVARRGYPMANNAFAAALRAHAFRRSFLEDEEAGDHPAITRAHTVPIMAPSRGFAAEVEAQMLRDLNSDRQPVLKLVVADEPAGPLSTLPAAAGGTLTAELGEAVPMISPPRFEKYRRGGGRTLGREPLLGLSTHKLPRGHAP